MIFNKKLGNSGKLVIGIHGWGGSHETFKPFEKIIPSSFSMINFDLPGYGKSPKPDYWNMNNIVEDLSLEINSITSDAIDIIGNCSGALIAILLSKSPNLKVNNLYLIDPFSRTPWYFKIFTNKFFGEYVYTAIFQNPLGRIFTNLSLKNNRAEETDMTSSFKNIDKDTSLNYLKMLVELEGTDAMEGINCKPIIINGEKTFKAAKESVKYYSSIWNNLNLINIENVGHLPIEENPTEIVNIISRT